MPTATLTLTYNNGNWSNPTNAIGANNQYATYNASAPGANVYMRFTTNASALIPANAVITGVSVHVEYRVNTTAGTPRFMAGPGEFGGNGYSSDVFPNTADTIYVFGGAGNTLGPATLANVSNCSIRNGNNAAGTAQHICDDIRMYVDWAYPTAGGNTVFFGNNF